MIILKRIIVIALFLLSAVAFPVHAAGEGVSSKKGAAGADPFKGMVSRAYDLRISWFYNWGPSPFYGWDAENLSATYWDNPNLKFIPMFRNWHNALGLQPGCKTQSDKDKITSFVNSAMEKICKSTAYCNKGNYYLIGNEPELADQDLSPNSGDPAGGAVSCYGLMMQTLKAKDPTAKFIILGAAWVNENFIRNFISKWKTVWQGTDMEILPQIIKSWHLHTYGNYWECPMDDSIPRSFLNIVNSQMQTIFGQTVFDQELWVTEMGSLNNLPNLSNQIERQKFLNRMKCLVDVYENSPIIARYAWFYAGGSGWGSTSLYGRSSSGGYYITDLGIRYSSLPISSAPTPPLTTDQCLCSGGKPPKTLGNANCDDKINRLDLSLWISQFVDGRAYLTNSADFNCDGNVDRLDLSFWINGFANPDIPH